MNTNPMTWGFLLVLYFIGALTLDITLASGVVYPAGVATNALTGSQIQPAGTLSSAFNLTSQQQQTSWSLWDTGQTLSFLGNFFAFGVGFAGILMFPDYAWINIILVVLFHWLPAAMLAWCIYSAFRSGT